jgi:hypothetical protein
MGSNVFVIDKILSFSLLINSYFSIIFHLIKWEYFLMKNIKIIPDILFSIVNWNQSNLKIRTSFDYI